jgi:predicted ABC-type ATPase/gluconate kinase
VRGVPVLWLCGPSGVGKSTVGYELFERLGGDGVPVAFVDLDQLRLCGPAPDGDPMNHAVRALTLGAVWSGFLAAGARCVVLSGLVSDAGDVRRHARRLPGGDLTVCRLRVRPDELRERFARRGAYPELAGETMRDAENLDRTRFADVVVDTSGRSVAGAVAALRASWPGPLSTVDARPEVPARVPVPGNGGSSVLLICGPPGVGKSTVGFEVFMRAQRRGVPAAYVDLAQLAFCRPAPVDDPEHHRLKAGNVGRMWEAFRADGARLLVVTGNVTDRETVDRYRRAVAPSAFSVCRLRARPETLAERILLRGRGGGPGIVGDDFRGRPEAELRRRAEEAVRTGHALDRSRLGDVAVDTDGRQVADLAASLAARLGPR